MRLSSATPTPERGEICLANLSPRGIELGKTHPVLLVQAQSLIEAGHPSTLIIPLTTNLVDEAEPLRIRIKARTSLRRDSDLLIDQLRAIRTCYFFAYGPSANEPQHKEALYQLGLKAFNEDRVMIEAQQRNINRSPDAKMLTIAIDSGVAQFRHMMDDLIQAEREQEGASAAGR